MQDKKLFGRFILAAFLVISFIIVGIALFFNVISVPTGESYPIYLNGNQSERYYPMTFGEMKEYGLAPEDAVGLTKENRYVITADDLGEWIGTVTDCLDRSMVNCKVYAFAKFPDDPSICIVDALNGHQFYTLSRA